MGGQEGEGRMGRRGTWRGKGEEYVGRKRGISDQCNKDGGERKVQEKEEREIKIKSKENEARKT